MNRNANVPSFLAETILVIGGTGSIGKAIACHLAQCGANTLIAAKDVCEDEELFHQTRFCVDISVESSVVSLFERLDARGFQIQALVNAAGVGVFKRMDQITAADWAHVMNTNATGTFYCCREALRRMVPTGGGRIVSIGSIATEVALPSNALYAASKACIKAMFRVMNEEYKDANIRSTTIHLGAVSSSVWDSRPEFDRDSMLSPLDVARMVAHILSLPLDIRVDEITLTPSKGVL